jgi:hypothetical protein
MPGIIGGALALTGCLAGNILSGCYFVAQQEAVSYSTVLGALDFALASEILTVMFSPMDLLFYGLAIYEGFKLGGVGRV